jgi:hypothetical protein
MLAHQGLEHRPNKAHRRRPDRHARDLRPGRRHQPRQHHPGELTSKTHMQRPEVPEPLTKLSAVDRPRDVQEPVQHTQQQRIHVAETRLPPQPLQHVVEKIRRREGVQPLQHVVAVLSRSCSHVDDPGPTGNRAVNGPNAHPASARMRPFSIAATTSSLPSNALSKGDEDVATPARLSRGQAEPNIRSTASRPVIPAVTPKAAACGVNSTIRASSRSSGSASGSCGVPRAIANA